MRAIITRGLYTFYPIFEGQKRFLKELFFVKFWPYVWLVFKSGFKSRAGYSGARTVPKIFRVWAKKFTAQQLKLENNVKNTRCLFYYLKIIWKFQFLKKAIKRAKTLKEQWKNPTFFKIITEGERWRNFSLTFLESTKNLVVIIHRS
jgi:hypothetical protein